MNKQTVFIYFFFLIACNNSGDIKKSVKPAPLPDEVLKLEKSMNLYPDSIGLQMRLVNALDSLGKTEEAIKRLDVLISKDSGNFGFWFKKGQLSEQLKDTNTAIQSYNWAAKVYASPDALLALANLYAEKRNVQALNLIQTVSALRMGRIYQSHCDFIAGIYFSRVGNSSKAIQYFNKCIYNNYTYMEAYMELGFIYYDKKQFTDALKTFQTTIAVKNNYPDAYYWMGKTYEAKNIKDSAISNYQEAIDLDPNLKEAAIAINRIKSQNTH